MTKELALLEYERHIFSQLLEENGLVVMARGLGIDRIFTSFLQLYCTDPGMLVLVLNTTSQDEEYFQGKLELADITPLPRSVTSGISIEERRKMYTEGGTFFITSRILVVDMLTEKIPIDLVTGILVYRAHKVVESCQEAFILRLYREKNKTGFIKAFTDASESFTHGFAQAERVLKTLFVRNLYLWPRFQADVLDFLEKENRKPDVVELHVSMTTEMKAVQMALLDIIAACIRELRTANTQLDVDEVTVENAIGRSFDSVIKWQLEPVWHQLGEKTKNLVADIKHLRKILCSLTTYDCVTFYNTVNALRNNERAFGQNAGWLFLDSAESLFVHSRRRLYRSVAPNAKKKKTTRATATEEAKAGEHDADTVLVVDMEQPAKWTALSDILKEIDGENKMADTGAQELGEVLVCTEDDVIAEQLREYLENGAQSVLTRLYNSTIAAKQGKPPLSLGDQKNGGKYKGKSSSKAKAKNTHNPILPDILDDTEEIQSSVSGDDKKEQENASCYYKILSSPIVIIHPLHGNSDPYSLSRVLHQVEPRFVVLYDIDLAFIRQLEVYKAARPNMALRVYFMMYADSTDEQRYLTMLRKEKEAFEFLIREKASMVIPEEYDGKSSNNPILERGVKSANQTVSTRKGGASQQPVESDVRQKILVDMREFRSELPSLLHRRDIDIVPLTIEVGDYILTPEVCVERKSVSDLIGSLNNGRLYNQCLAMSRHYKRPVLLIEFDQNKPFSLQFQGKSSTMSNDIQSSDTLSKLTLLTLHFPLLRILWCASPYATAEIFGELKVDKEQPDEAAAKAITVASCEFSLPGMDRFNHNTQDFVMKLPGVSSKNYRQLLSKVRDLAELVSLTEERLGEILDNKAFGKQLYEFIHKEKEESKTKGKSSFHSRRWRR
ncbi:PREDICTED: DNA repair endonuclease XPF-like [Priapulus caudatus]|uniref:DNA repair endonuclease XPF-like n=1 Tax=Priapulus caudatus TaxID=37621 RepID=A0ABM1FB54_PRICU|nr:PREDICTED: DNA repair endonuclease XPF-like [Priapulus caudatus]